MGAQINHSKPLKHKEPVLEEPVDQDWACFGYKRVPIKDKVQWVMDHFNTVAKKYDFMNTVLSGGIHHLWKRTAVNLLELRPGQTVLDVCGGTGDLALLAARAVGPTGQVLLYDMNWAMIERGRPRVSTSCVGDRIRYVQGNAEIMGLEKEVFDAAMIGFGIRNLTDMKKGLKEMVRVLKPGGKLMCLEFSMPTAPLFRKLYDLHSFYIMPLLGKIFVGSEQAYLYLPESIRLFPPPDTFSQLFEKVGLTHVRYKKKTNGIAVIHVGQKPK